MKNSRAAFGLGAALNTAHNFGLGDLLGGGDTGATPLPGAEALSKAYGDAAAAAPSMFSVPPVATHMPDAPSQAMALTLGGRTWRLEVGDCLALHVDGPIEFHNPTRRAARYAVVIADGPAQAVSRRQVPR